MIRLAFHLFKIKWITYLKTCHDISIAMSATIFVATTEKYWKIQIVLVHQKSKLMHFNLDTKDSFVLCCSLFFFYFDIFELMVFHSLIEMLSESKFIQVKKRRKHKKPKPSSTWIPEKYQNVSEWRPKSRAYRSMTVKR